MLQRPTDQPLGAPFMGVWLRLTVLAALLVLALGQEPLEAQTGEPVERCFGLAETGEPLNKVVVQPADYNGTPIGDPILGNGCFLIPEGPFWWFAEGRVRTRERLTHTANGIDSKASRPGDEGTWFYGNEIGSDVTELLDGSRTDGRKKKRGYLEGLLC